MGHTEQNMYSITTVHTKVNPKQHKISNTCIVLWQWMSCYYSQVY